MTQVCTYFYISLSRDKNLQNRVTMRHSAKRVTVYQGWRLMAIEQTDRERAARALWETKRCHAEATAAKAVAVHLRALQDKYGPDPRLAHLADAAITMGENSVNRARALLLEATDALASARPDDGRKR